MLKLVYQRMCPCLALYSNYPTFTRSWWLCNLTWNIPFPRTGIDVSMNCKFLLACEVMVPYHLCMTTIIPLHSWISSTGNIRKAPCWKFPNRPKKDFVFESYKKPIIIFTVYVVSGVPLFKVYSNYCLHHLRRLNLYWLPGYTQLLIFAILNRLFSWYLRDDVCLVDSNEGAGWDGKNQCKALSCSWRCHPRTLQEEWGTICLHPILNIPKPILGVIW